MKRIALISTVFAMALGAAACGDDSGTTKDGGMTADTGPTGDQPPALGTQIDRMGRPGVNTALTAPFDAPATHDTKQNAYNAAKDPAGWTTFAADIKQSLAILDSLDIHDDGMGNAIGGCGNQFAADLMAGSRYTALAGVLADDRLFVDTSRATCAQYLAVEANATAIITNNDCGGRTPTEDVILTTYSALAAGTLTGVDDGIAMDDQTHSNTVFPFIADPVP